MNRKSPATPQTQTGHVCLLGVSFETGNMGVRALLASLVRLVTECRPAARITLIYGHSRPGLRELEVCGRKVPLRIVNYRLSPRSRPREHLVWTLLLAALARCVPAGAVRRWLWRRSPMLQALAEADFVGDIHGGDSFSDLYGFRRFLLEILPDLIVILLGKELVLLPQTYGPYASPLARLAARFIMRRAGRLYARDRDSLKTVQALLGRSAAPRSVQYCPDVAFALEPAQPGPGAIQPPLEGERAGLLVGLNISGLLAMGGYSRNNMFGLRLDYRQFIETFIGRLLAEPQTRVLILPHVIDQCAENDMGVCREIWQRQAGKYGGRLHLLTEGCDQSQLKHLIGQCDFLFGSRMHACIGALSQGIPGVGIAYSAKFHGVFDGAGVADLAVDARQLSAEELLGRCLELLRQREAIRRRLAAQIPVVRAQLFLCFEYEVLNPALSASAPQGREALTVTP